jgi:hypothetical protein
MALASYQLIEALRKAAQQLRSGAPYAWGHHGQCNCGHLIQVTTALSDQDIQRLAHTGSGEWTELADDYCTVTGAPVDAVLHHLMELGLTPSDVQHLEFLSDKAVLQHLDGGFRWLKHNRRDDAVAYFEAFARMLEEQLLDAALRDALRDTAPIESSPRLVEA